MKHFNQALVLWEMLRDIPTDEHGITIDIPYIHFPAGTLVLDIWHWFEDTFEDFSVGLALNGKYRKNQECLY